MNAAQLGATLSDSLRGTRLIVVGNREPYIHMHRKRSARGVWNWLRGRTETEGIEWVRPASGLVTALDPVMRATGGTWIAHGSGNADRETADVRGRLAVPPDRPSYTLRRVWLTEEEEQGYYYGCANNALWPLCHIAYARPEFDDQDWHQYVKVNRRFADAVIEEVAEDRAVVFVQDYHFALLSRFVKEARPDITVCQFWHIPWPNREVFRVCPWGEDILHGLLGNDLLGFHVQYHCNNFLDTVDRALESRVDYENFAAWRGGRPTYVRPFPISIDPSLWKGPGKASERANESRSVRKMLGLTDERIIFGVDRLDYTKGIPDRLKAFARLLERYPEWHGRVTLVQVGAPSREHLRRYQALMTEVETCVTQINAKYRTDGWMPIIYRPQHHQPELIAGMYRAADVCVVSSLHDGMNLVAKEFIASRNDEYGVLVLSEFTGAARELEQAVHVNPFAVDSFADALHTALMISPVDQRRRMLTLRERIASHTVFDWANELLTAAVRRMEPVR
ncbi:MAG TPA: trehalose-6-phosphate synthase [Vicinamibacterales bacterium]|nr:trehalose-6-phosphate synthase [Vicinamibacterales bacterium]